MFLIVEIPFTILDKPDSTCFNESEMFCLLGSSRVLKPSSTHHATALKSRPSGGIAQLVERLVRNQKVGGSIPPVSTTISRPTVLGWAFPILLPARHAGFSSIMRVPTVGGQGATTRPVRLCSALSSLETCANFFAVAHACGLHLPRLACVSAPAVVRRPWWSKDRRNRQLLRVPALLLKRVALAAIDRRAHGLEISRRVRSTPGLRRDVIDLPAHLRSLTPSLSLQFFII